MTITDTLPNMRFEPMRLANARRAREGSRKGKAMPSKARQPDKAKPEAKAAPKVRTYSEAEYHAHADVKSKEVKQTERSRIAAVVSSGAAKGKQRTTLEMLAFGELSGTQIVSALNSLPTDAQLDANRAANRHARNREIWDRATGKLPASKGHIGLMSAAMKELRR